MMLVRWSSAALVGVSLLFGGTANAVLASDPEMTPVLPDLSWKICPLLDGKAMRVTHGLIMEPFKISCGIDYPSADILPSPVPIFSDGVHFGIRACMMACGKYDNCTAVSFSEGPVGSESGDCYLKGNVTTRDMDMRDANPHIISAVMLQEEEGPGDGYFSLGGEIVLDGIWHTPAANPPKPTMPAPNPREHESVVPGSVSSITVTASSSSPSFTNFYPTNTLTSTSIYGTAADDEPGTGTPVPATKTIATTVGTGLPPAVDSLGVVISTKITESASVQTASTVKTSSKEVSTPLRNSSSVNLVPSSAAATTDEFLSIFHAAYSEIAAEKAYSSVTTTTEFYPTATLTSTSIYGTATSEDPGTGIPVPATKTLPTTVATGVVPAVDSLGRFISTPLPFLSKPPSSAGTTSSSVIESTASIEISSAISSPSTAATASSPFLNTTASSAMSSAISSPSATLASPTRISPLFYPLPLGSLSSLLKSSPAPTLPSISASSTLKWHPYANATRTAVSSPDPVPISTSSSSVATSPASSTLNWRPYANATRTAASSSTPDSILPEIAAVAATETPFKSAPFKSVASRLSAQSAESACGSSTTGCGSKTSAAALTTATVTVTDSCFMPSTVEITKVVTTTATCEIEGAKETVTISDCPTATVCLEGAKETVTAVSTESFFGPLEVTKTAFITTTLEIAAPKETVIITSTESFFGPLEITKTVEVPAAKETVIITETLQVTKTVENEGAMETVTFTESFFGPMAHTETVPGPTITQAVFAPGATVVSTAYGPAPPPSTGPASSLAASSSPASSSQASSSTAIPHPVGPVVPIAASPEPILPLPAGEPSVPSQGEPEILSAAIPHPVETVTPTEHYSGPATPAQTASYTRPTSSLATFSTLAPSSGSATPAQTASYTRRPTDSTSRFATLAPSSSVSSSGTKTHYGPKEIPTGWQFAGKSTASSTTSTPWLTVLPAVVAGLWSVL